jgi:hypothetical protein
MSGRRCLGGCRLRPDPERSRRRGWLSTIRGGRPRLHPSRPHSCSFVSIRGSSAPSSVSLRDDGWFSPTRSNTALPQARRIIRVNPCASVVKKPGLFRKCRVNGARLKPATGIPVSEPDEPHGECHAPTLGTEPAREDVSTVAGCVPTPCGRGLRTRSSSSIPTGAARRCGRKPSRTARSPPWGSAGRAVYSG